MGNLLTQVPFSEIVATVELLSAHGVTRADLQKLRASSPEVQKQVAHIIRNADSVTRISVISQGVLPANQPQKKLLQFVTTVSVAAIESFKAADHFKADTKKATTPIWYLSEDFKKHFGRKVEGASEVAEIKVHKLTEASLDAPIITELADKCEITLGQFFALLQKQGRGGPGPLLTSGWTNIAYIRDDEGNLWAVDAYWHADDGCWYVGACSVEYPLVWREGRRVLSR